MADERLTDLNQGLDKWMQFTADGKLETWDGTDKTQEILEALGVDDKASLSFVQAVTSSEVIVNTQTYTNTGVQATTMRQAQLQHQSGSRLL